MKISVQELLIILLHIAICFVIANIAAKKGLSKFGFWIFGFFALPIALPAVLLWKNENPVNKAASSEDELNEYKDLYETGVITQAEYEAKKNKYPSRH